MIQKIFIVMCCLLLVQIGFSQIKINTNIGTTTMNTNSAFLDASSSPSWNNITNTNLAKGLVFPRVDLTTMANMAQAGTTGPTNNPNRFDGMLVYNTATGTSGIGLVAVKPGFYYYSNKSVTLNGGTWLAVVSKDAVVATSVVTKTASYVIVDSDSTVLCNATGGGFTVSLPDAAINSGKTFIISKTDTSDNALTFSPSLKFAEGVLVSVLNYTKTLKVQSDGTSWVVVN
ncbi:hypothetical protein EKM05_02065 [Flavobacterium sp. GSP27]|uniref:hypothetical protein n=1 Tax=Flavobacterium sp. GSP27 TaxID=2497489 RepID=UPI000F8401C6|nr:hypothetical protein [Flavobacterium sp. GSP27]RTZ10704.1 hypothetical protein EKM05_02065 [Flavobacterium sp. GSP27]